MIHIFLPGALGQHGSWDPKPEAAAEYRGEFGAIGTKVPGMQLCELLEKTVGVADKLTLLRGVWHTESAHERGQMTMLTGWRPSPAVIYPSMGSIVSHELGARENLPPFVTIPSTPDQAGTGYLSPTFGAFSVGGDPSKPGFTVQDLALPAGVDATRGAEVAAPSFENDVVPVLMRYGCTAGGCHGATRGKDGFRLSLFGYDPEADHFRLTREFVNRRVNVAMPEDSLLLKKAAGTVPHGGGKKLTPDDANFTLVRDWIAAGAPKGSADEAHLGSVSVFPADLTLDAAGQSHRLVVMGSFTDGSQRDVTHLSILESSDDSIASVSREGIVTSHRRGEVFISVRLPAFISGVRVDVVPGQEPPAALTKGWNFIDEAVYARLSKLRKTAAEVCSDDDFVRRVFIDTIGLLPTIQEYEQFKNDPRSDKRAHLVDSLLARPEFTDLWAMKWGERLQARSIVSASASHQKATLRYTAWLHRQIENEAPMNEVIHQLIAAKGTWIENPETNFYRERDPKLLMENMAQLFLGARIQCAQRHNHPFDRWTQNDYYGMVAFFARTQKKNGEDMMDMLVYEAPAGETTHPVTLKSVPPKFLGGALVTTAAQF